MNTETLKQEDQHTYTPIPSQKIFLWIAMCSMTMVFAAFTSAYIVRQAEGNWVHFELPKVFYVSTVFIILSSVSMYWALHSIKRNDKSNLLTGLLITLGLGLAFTFTQFLGWAHLVKEKIFFTGNPSGSFLYVITAVHLAHLFGGIIYMLVVITKSIRNKYSVENNLQIQLCSIYWHFLDVLWIYLFLFLLFIR